MLVVHVPLSPGTCAHATALSLALPALAGSGSGTRQPGILTLQGMPQHGSCFHLGVREPYKKPLWATGSSQERQEEEVKGAQIHLGGGAETAKAGTRRQTL